MDTYLAKDILKEYIYDITIRNYTARTIKGYRNNLLRFFKYCEVELEIVIYIDDKGNK